MVKPYCLFRIFVTVLHRCLMQYFCKGGVYVYDVGKAVYGCVGIH